MNWVDGLLIALVLLGGFFGWRRGLISGLMHIAIWVGSLVLGFLFYRPVGSWFHDVAGWSEIWTSPGAFVVIVIAGYMAIGAAASALSLRIPLRIHRVSLNRLLGIVPGLFEGAVNAVIVALLLVTLPLPSGISQPVRQSPAAGALAAKAERLAGIFDPIFGEAVSQALTYLTVPTDSAEQIDLNFTVAAPAARPDLEVEMIGLVNRERESRGLAPLQPDPELRVVARAHSTDMFAVGYFGHVTPGGSTPYDRLRDAGVAFLVAGENLALAPTLALAHQGLMDSPGHRENILRPQFGRIGIGIFDGGRYGLMVTQMFRD